MVKGGWDLTFKLSADILLEVLLLNHVFAALESYTIEPNLGALQPLQMLSHHVMSVFSLKCVIFKTKENCREKSKNFYISSKKNVETKK